VSFGDLLRRLRPEPRSLPYLALALLATAPAWVDRYPPMMDVPFHQATIRIIHDLHDERFGFDRDFTLSFGGTQYLGYYLVGSALAYILGVFGANAVLMSAYLAGTVLGMRALLRALGKDERACVLVVPLLVNVLFMYGLFPFLIGIPIMLFALASTVRYFARPTLAGGARLAVLTVALFYSHVFPFGVWVIGFAAMFPWTRPRDWLASAAPSLPAFAAAAWWTLGTAAGQLTSGALGDTRHDPHKRIGEAIAAVHEYFIDVFRDLSDDAIFITLGVIVVTAFVLAQGDRDRSPPIARAYGLLPIVCALFYFLTPDEHGYISIISQRFPILATMTAIPLVRIPRGWRGVLVTTAATILAVGTVANVCVHFRSFAREEVGDIEGAIGAMEPRKHVCALIFERESKITKLQPFLHFGSYYQVEKGGVVEFTYAGYAHWPIDFKPGRYPPPGGPARRLWEWEPEKVTIDEIYPYYDYVLTRGAGFDPPASTYHLQWHSEPWTVWARD
jgi:hypothetical protein